MTTTNDNARTWRDLTDQLTPEQVARFAHQEAMALASLHNQPSRQGWVPESADDIIRGFLNEARWEAEQNHTDSTINVPLPAGVDLEDAEHWEQDDTGTWTRLLHCTNRAITGFDAYVYLDGVQTRDGAVTWSLYAHVEDRHGLTSDQVRQLAANLVAAAEELDSLNR